MMDFVSNLFKKSKEKNTCLKKEAEICNNQNKNLHLFDMESSFLQNSVLAPVEFNTDQNVVLNESIDTNQENLNPRYSVLNTFDPIINKEPDEILLKSQIEDNPSDSTNEQSQENIDDSFGDTETFVNDIIEDYLENAFVLTAAKESVISYSQDLNSSGSQNSNVLDTTKLLDGTFIVDVAPKLTNASDNDLVKENVLDSSNYSNDSHNVSSTLSTDTIVEVNLNYTDEQNISTEEQTLVSDNKSIILNDSNLEAQNTPNITQANDSLVSQNENGSFDSIGENERSVEEEHINEHINILDSTHENSTTKADELIAPSTQISEELHMSATEPVSDLKDSEETSATCTNEMGEIINQNECFEKQSDISNSTIDNFAECEKYKMQIIDLKEELKSCRQKTVTLETEVIDFKRKENELNVILKEYKQTNMSKDEQLKYLQANEEVLKNEIKELRESIKQYEINLKELQRKDTDEHDEQFKNLKANEETLKNEIKELKALIKQQETQSHSELQIGRVMEEYEKSISSLITENEKMKKERDTAQMHLANIEMAFSDVHQKYERCKAIVQGYKDNEESFKQDIAMNRETIVIQEQKYETLKAHAMGQLEKSNQELAAMKKQHETEMARLTAQLKRYEIKNMSLMESLQQKAKECEQLSAVCDEFIGNV